MSLFRWSILLLIFFATAKYTLGPIFIRLKNSASADLTFHEIPDEHARALFPQNFFALIHQFEALGFSFVCHLSISMTTNTHGMISLLVNRSTGTFATITCVRSLAAAAPAVVSYIECIADFEDGSQLNISNSSTVGVFYQPPRKTQIKVPHLKDPNALYQVHLHLMKQRNVAARLPEPGTEKEHFINSTKRSLAEQVELGFYYLDQTKQCYRPTWRGAYRATYRSLWPLKQIHQRRQSQAGRRIAVEALRSK